MYIEIAMHAELRDEPWQNAKKSPLIKVMQAEQLMEPIHSMRRPVAPSFNHEIPLRGLELDAKDLRDDNLRRRLPARGSKQKRGDENSQPDEPNSHSPIIAEVWTYGQETLGLGTGCTRQGLDQDMPFFRRMIFRVYCASPLKPAPLRVTCLSTLAFFQH